jgi:hypothetical protein
VHYWDTKIAGHYSKCPLSDHSTNLKKTNKHPDYLITKINVSCWPTTNTSSTHSNFWPWLYMFIYLTIIWEGSKHIAQEHKQKRQHRKVKEMGRSSYTCGGTGNGQVINKDLSSGPGHPPPHVAAIWATTVNTHIGGSTLFTNGCFPATCYCSSLKYGKIV